MNVSDLKFPDFSDHPPPPQLTYEQYQRWVCEDILPELHRCGEMTEEKLIADFMNNEGRVTAWPDFGLLRETPCGSDGGAGLAGATQSESPVTNERAGGAT